jgi:hypothetical protein
MASSNTFNPDGGIVARRASLRRGRGRSAAPLWPGMIPPPRAQRRLPPPGGRSWLVLATALVASLATVAVVLVYTAAATNPRRSVATVTDPVLGGGPGCEPTRTDQLVRGNGTGSTASGPDVILAFQHAYYVVRSGAAARSLTTPDATVSSVELIDKGIASIPAATEHCVLVTPMLDGRFDVVITEIRPNTPVRTYRQFVTVTDSNGIFAINKITPPS